MATSGSHVQRRDRLGTSVICPSAAARFRQPAPGTLPGHRAVDPARRDPRRPAKPLVFSPARSGRYDLDTISSNLLSPTVAPDPTRYYYQDMERKHSQAPRTFSECQAGNRVAAATTT